MRRFLTYWLPPLLWTAMILAASSDVFSSSHTGGWISQLASRILPWLSPSTLENVNRVLRKAGHLTAYGVLSGFWFRALRGERPGWDRRWAIGAVTIAVLVASIDEYHQSFIPSRTGTWHDVVLDACGAILVQIAIRTALVLLFRQHETRPLPHSGRGIDRND